MSVKCHKLSFVEFAANGNSEPISSDTAMSTNVGSDSSANPQSISTYIVGVAAILSFS